MSASTATHREDTPIAGMAPLTLPPSPPADLVKPNGSLRGRSLSDEVPFGQAASLAPVAAAVASVAHVATGLNVAQTAAPSGDLNSRSIAEAADGAPRRITLKSYWEHGFWTGVYYLFQYHLLGVSDFFWREKKQEAMDEIYSAVNKAIEEEDIVDIEELADTLFDQSKYSRASVGRLFLYDMNMIIHALGSKAHAQKLYARLGELSDLEIEAEMHEEILR